MTAVTLLTGGRVKGLLRERQLRRLPHRRCLLIGEAVTPEVLLCKDACIASRIPAGSSVSYAYVLVSMPLWHAR